MGGAAGRWRIGETSRSSPMSRASRRRAGHPGHSGRTGQSGHGIAFFLLPGESSATVHSAGSGGSAKVYQVYSCRPRKAFVFSKGFHAKTSRIESGAGYAAKRPEQHERLDRHEWHKWHTESRGALPETPDGARRLACRPRSGTGWGDPRLERAAAEHSRNNASGQASLRSLRFPYCSVTYSR
jgi:hypothetical protein